MGEYISKYSTGKDIDNQLDKVNELENELIQQKGEIIASLNSAIFDTQEQVFEGSVWQLRESPYAGWSSICYGNGLFVAVASSGSYKVMTSSNGVTWTERVSVSDNYWNSVCYGNGLFVAVSNNAIMTSPDGINWTPGVSPVDIVWTGVCYGNGLFVAVGKGATINNSFMTSPDGITWTAQSAANDYWRSVCYGNGLFVAVSNSGNSTSKVITSPDGITWTLRYTGGNNNYWYSICYGNGLFVAVGTSSLDNKRIMTSSDGVTWTIGVMSTQQFSWTGVCYGDGLFVAVATFVRGNKIATSTDGINWELKISTAEVKLKTICYGNNMFIGIGNGTDGCILTSYDNISFQLEMINSLNKTIFNSNLSRFESEKNPGTYWTIRNTPNGSFSGVCYGDGLFVAVSTTVTSGIGNDAIMTSSDGITWITRPIEGRTATSVCYGNGLFVAVSNSGVGNRVMTSPDGITWTIRSSAADNNWVSICYGNGLFVAVSTTGVGNRVMTSPDGITWTIRSSTADNSWYSICYGNGLFVAISNTGTGNRVMTSSDGITWTIRSSAADNNWNSVCYGNGLFVAVSTSGDNKVMTSPDGINWTLRTTPITIDTWNTICYGNGLFVAISNTGNAMTSFDGINWTIHIYNIGSSWRSICYGNGLFVTVGTGGGDYKRAMTSGILNKYNYIDLDTYLSNYLRNPYSGPVDDSSTSTQYIVTLEPKLPEYRDGLSITIIPNINCDPNPTLNCCNIGDIPLLDNGGIALTKDAIRAGRPYSFVKIGDGFYQLGGSDSETLIMKHITNISVLSSNWIDETPTTLLYRYRITNPEILSTDSVDVLFDVSSIINATEQGVLGITTAGDGYVDIYSSRVVTSNLTCSLRIIR
jgi:hypothetical protein